MNDSLQLLIDDIVNYLKTADKVTPDWFSNIIKRSLLLLFPNTTIDGQVSCLAILLDYSTHNIMRCMSGEYVPSFLESRKTLRIIVDRAEEIIKQNNIDKMLSVKIEDKILGVDFKNE